MSPRGSGPSPGTRLRIAREGRGLSIEDVAERLRLNAALVLALEEDRMALLGAPVFAKGHLRNYALLVGIPEAEIMAAWEADEIPEPSFLPALDLKLKRRGAASWGWPLAAVALALVLVAVFWWWTTADGR